MERKIGWEGEDKRPTETLHRIWDDLHTVQNNIQMVTLRNKFCLGVS